MNYSTSAQSFTPRHRHETILCITIFSSTSYLGGCKKVLLSSLLLVVLSALCSCLIQCYNVTFANVTVLLKVTRQAKISCKHIGGWAYYRHNWRLSWRNCPLFLSSPKNKYHWWKTNPPLTCHQRWEVVVEFSRTPQPCLTEHIIHVWNWTKLFTS